MAAHNMPTRMQLDRDARQLADFAREWGAAAVDAVQATLRRAGAVLAQLLMLAAVIALVVLMMGAGR